jgi:hypothetical protein
MLTTQIVQYNNGQVSGGGLSVPSQDVSSGSTFDMIATVTIQGMKGQQIVYGVIGGTGPLDDFQVSFGPDASNLQPLISGSDWETATTMIPAISLNLSNIVGGTGTPINTGGVFWFLFNMPTSGCIAFSGKASHATTVALQISY